MVEQDLADGHTTGLPLTLRLSAAFECPGSWTLSASSPLVPAVFVLLCTRSLAGYVLLAEESAADVTMPAGYGMFAAGLVRSSVLSRSPHCPCCRELPPPLLPPLWRC
jgi:hypothetical protein